MLYITSEQPPHYSEMHQAVQCTRHEMGERANQGQ